MFRQCRNCSGIRQMVSWTSCCCLVLGVCVGCGGRRQGDNGATPKRPKVVVENKSPKKPKAPKKKTPKTKPKTPKIPEATGVKFQAKVSWTEKKFDDGGRKKFPRMRVTIDATGGDAAKTFRYGRLKIGKIIDQREKPLKVLRSATKLGPGANVFTGMVWKSMSPHAVDPKDGFRFGFEVAHPDVTPMTIQKLQGTLRFETVTPKVIKINELASRVGSKIDNPELKDSSTNVSLAKEVLVQLSLSWKKGKSPIAKVILKQTKGQKIEPERTPDISAKGDREQRVHRWRIPRKSKSQTVLEIVLADKKTKRFSIPLKDFPGKIENKELAKAGIETNLKLQEEIKATVMGQKVLGVVVKNSKGKTISRNREVVSFLGNSKVTLSAPVTSPADELEITIATEPREVEAKFDLKDISVPPIPRTRP